MSVKVRPIPSHRHPIKVHQQKDNQQYESYNWSGYAVTGSAGSGTDVKGSWVVPTVSCSQAPTGYSSFWVGIDGFSSNTVEQIGTDSDCVSLNGTQTGTATYYAWFEFYPQSAYLIEFSRGIKPGDTITAEVQFKGNVGFGFFQRGGLFTVTITDVTQNEKYSTSAAVNGAQQSSVEWVAEAPCCTSSGTVLPLADFSLVNFSSLTATVSNVTKSIGQFGANVQEITMVSSTAPHPVKAQPSTVTTSSTGFTDSWVSAGP